MNASKLVELKARLLVYAKECVADNEFYVVEILDKLDKRIDGQIKAKP